jgi:hypothetical protein
MSIPYGKGDNGTAGSRKVESGMEKKSSDKDADGDMTKVVEVLYSMCCRRLNQILLCTVLCSIVLK